MNRQTDYALKPILAAELDASKALHTLLMQERTALIEADLDNINQTIAKKQTLIMQLEQLNRQREAMLQAAGFPKDKDGLDAYIENQATDEREDLKQMVTAVREAAHACRDYNQINGGIVNVNRQYLQKAISILRGRDMNVAAYGPGGEYTSQIVRQPLLGRV